MRCHTAPLTTLSPCRHKEGIWKFCPGGGVLVRALRAIETPQGPLWACAEMRLGLRCCAARISAPPGQLQRRELITHRGAFIMPAAIPLCRFEAGNGPGTRATWPGGWPLITGPTGTKPWPGSIISTSTGPARRHSPSGRRSMRLACRRGCERRRGGHPERAGHPMARPCSRAEELEAPSLRTRRAQNYSSIHRQDAIKELAVVDQELTSTDGRFRVAQEPQPRPSSSRTRPTRHRLESSIRLPPLGLS